MKKYMMILAVLLIGLILMSCEYSYSDLSLDETKKAGETIAPSSERSAFGTGAAETGVWETYPVWETVFVDTDVPDDVYGVPADFFEGDSFTVLANIPASFLDYAVLCPDYEGESTIFEYERLMSIAEEALGCTCKVIMSDDLQKTLQTSFLAGDNKYDIVAGTLTEVKSFSAGSYLENVEDYLGYFGGSGWDTDFLNPLGGAYWVTGSLSEEYLYNRYCIAVNLSIWEELSGEDPYAWVRNGEWTAEKFVSVVSLLNGNDTINGLVYTEEAFPVLYMGCGMAFSDFDSSRTVCNEFGSSAHVTAVSVMEEALGTGKLKETESAEDLFTSGKALAWVTTLSHQMEACENSDYNIIVFPLFKGSAEDGYRTYIENCTVFGVTQCSRDAKKAAIFLDALSVIKDRMGLQDLRFGKYCHSAEDMEMAELISNLEVQSFAWVMEGDVLSEMVKSYTSASVYNSQYAGNAQILTKQLAVLLEKYR